MNNLKSPLFIGLFLITALVVGIFFTLPKYQELLSFSQEVARFQAEVQNQAVYFNSLKSASEELKNYQDKISKINSALPEDPSLSTLSAFLNQKAFQNGLILKKIVKASTTKSEEIKAEEEEAITEATTELATTTDENISAIEENQELQETIVNLSLIGSYPSFRNFLSAVERSARFIEVEKISINQSKERDNILNFDLELKIYSY